MEDLTGKQFGPYRIMGPLGEGGMASVYKAYQPSVDRYVAIKVLPRQFADDPQFFGRFEREAKVLAKLQHPHILPVHDYGQTDNYTYIVMPFVESGDLSDIIGQKRLSLAETTRIISQIGDALDYAHSQGIIHRDIKPSNILVDQRGNCLLTDFGIAKMVEGSTERLTVTGGIIGTPAYMSPEQGLGQTLDGRSDIYALGVILYEMITGQVPFDAETPMAVMIKHIYDPLQPPREFDAAIPESIERVVLKAMAKQPEDRFMRAGDMVQALQAAVHTAETVVPAAPDATIAVNADTADQTLELSSAKVSQGDIPPPVSTAGATSQTGSNPLLLWGGLGLMMLLVVIVILLSMLLFRRPPPNPAVAPPPANPQATALPPPAQAQPGPYQSGPSQPPPGAFEACRGVPPQGACTISTAQGSLSGTCTPFQGQLVCVPAGSPPPQGGP
jgi:serine/threonine protein kinase